MKRVFILGAGFSKQVGLPLATELTSLILEGTELKEVEDMQDWLADFKQRLAALEGKGGDASGFGINIEELFDFARYDIELWRMRQQLEPVDRGAGITAWRTAEDISTWLRYMEKELVHVIWDAQKKAGLEPIKRFTAELLPDDAVLTFNYDTLLECALSAQGKPWNHGLNDSSNGGVTVLKMHGSVDWILLERRPEKELEKFVKLFSKVDTNVAEHGAQPRKEVEYAWELWRAKDTRACNAVIEMDKKGLSNFRYFLACAGLGRYKPLHELPGSGLTWITAFKALKEADEIYVIGFSMSPYDIMARFHFTSVVRARKKPPTRVVVVNPSDSGLGGIMSIVFGGPLKLVEAPAEDVDWEDVLGQRNR
jgi:hypothetical protein